MGDPNLARAEYLALCERLGIKPDELLDPIEDSKHSSPRAIRWPDRIWEGQLGQVTGRGTKYKNVSAFVRHWTMFGLKVTQDEEGGISPVLAAVLTERREEEYRTCSRTLSNAPDVYRMHRDEGMRKAVVDDVKALRVWAERMGYTELIRKADEFLVTLRVDQ
jgi:hypothetical protein